jgi:hypothetical protein
MQETAMMEQLGNVSQLQDLSGQASEGMGTLLNAPNLESNPYAQEWAEALEQNLGGMYDKAAGRVAQSFSQDIMPNISLDAALAGQSGSSRQGVAEGLAAQGAQRELADLANQLANQGSASMADFYATQYGQGLDAAKAGLLSAPAVAGMSQMPYQSLYGVGDLIQEQAYQPIQEDIDRYYYNQQAPWNDLSLYQGMITGVPGGLGTTTIDDPNAGGNKAGSALGGAASGAAMGSSFGPWGTAIGGVLGGLAGYYG